MQIDFQTNNYDTRLHHVTLKAETFIHLGTMHGIGLLCINLEAQITFLLCIVCALRSLPCLGLLPALGRPCQPQREMEDRVSFLYQSRERRPSQSVGST